MKHTFTTFLLFCFSHAMAYAQLYDTIYFDGNGSVCSADEAMYYRIVEKDRSTPHHYLVKDYYMNDQIEMSCTFSCINPYHKSIGVYSLSSPSPNIKHGLYQRWYRNGNLRIRCHYVEDRADGVFEYYYPSGKAHHIAMIKGVKNGKTKQWHANGKLRYEGEYKDGYQHGRWVHYNDSGTVTKEIVYDKGVCVNPKEVRYEFLTHLPKDYDADKSKQWPLIIFLHGSGLAGKGLQRIQNGVQSKITEQTDSFIVVAPSCPTRWTEDVWLQSLLTDVSRAYRIDKHRVYLTGISMGASGTWDLAVRHPELFAAIAPLSGSVESSYVFDHIERIKDLPVWAFSDLQGDLSINQKTEELILKLKSCGGEPKYTRYPHLAHNIWDETYSNPGFYKWLLKQHKSGR